MKISKIKPIPKYIQKIMTKIDNKRDLAYNSRRFYSYYTKNDGELVKVTVAARSGKGKVHLKQVSVHGLDSKVCFVKDMEFHYISGHVVGWHSEGLTKHKPWYEDGVWYECNSEKLFNPWSIDVNKEYILTIPEFKYSAFNLYPHDNAIKYLRLYRIYPHMELLVKLGFIHCALSKQILDKTKKDKRFIRFLLDNKDEIQRKYYNVDVILDSYKTGKPFAVVQEEKREIYDLLHETGYKEVKGAYKGKMLLKFARYVSKNKISLYSYGDYYEACKKLEIDMTLDKNAFPKNFKRWHDIRIDEYNSAKAEIDKKEREKLYNDFLDIANKYLPLQHKKRSAFIVVIAKSPAELIKEGSILHHCVGKMNYDQKFIREESLIFFIRNKQEPEIPYVTVEYSPKDKKILQIHGDHNERPNDKTMHYINKIWLPYANKTIEQIAA